MKPPILAVIVTYYPELQALARLISALKEQVEMLLIVDNGSPSEFCAWISSEECPGITSLFMRENLGVAGAHNRAIEWARGKGFSYAIFFDQDSLPARDMVSVLYAAERELLESGKNVAVVGPQFYDPRYLRAAPFIQLNGWKINRVSCNKAEGVSSVHCAEYLITSGSLIRFSVLDAVGPMDESLFIDYVDIEWGLRAKSLGYQCFGICAAKMRHSLGDRAIVWKDGKWIAPIPVHSPLRNYYLFRNAILLYKRKYAALPWVLNDAYRLMLKYGFYSIFTSPRLQNFKMMSLGLWHGILGRHGEYAKRGRH